MENEMPILSGVLGEESEIAEDVTTVSPATLSEDEKRAFQEIVDMAYSAGEITDEEIEALSHDPETETPEEEAEESDEVQEAEQELGLEEEHDDPETDEVAEDALDDLELEEGEEGEESDEVEDEMGEGAEVGEEEPEEEEEPTEEELEEEATGTAVGNLRSSIAEEMAHLDAQASEADQIKAANPEGDADEAYDAFVAAADEARQQGEAVSAAPDTDVDAVMDAAELFQEKMVAVNDALEALREYAQGEEEAAEDLDDEAVIGDAIETAEAEAEDY